MRECVLRWSEGEERERGRRVVFGDITGKGHITVACLSMMITQKLNQAGLKNVQAKWDGRDGWMRWMSKTNEETVQRKKLSAKFKENGIR